MTSRSGWGGLFCVMPAHGQKIWSFYGCVLSKLAFFPSICDFFGIFAPKFNVNTNQSLIKSIKNEKNY